MTSAILGKRESMSAFLTVEPRREGISMGSVPFQTRDLIRWRHTGSITARGRLPIDTVNRERRVADRREDTPPPGLFPYRLRTSRMRQLKGNPPLCFYV